ncbi:PleD family two-component system response regulator [Sphingobacterium corticis]|uniref:PleD family two-component system response regulator n=1 Tax=Sphingobacterium corticis TaxID=1812823 RepID=A0ABW5NIS9_9SPHI
MNKKVLIFEDDSATAEFSGIIADQLGFDVAYRTKTNNVLDDVMQEKPDLIIMDNWIPGKGGVASINMLKQNERTKQIPIIFYSANTDFANLAQSTKADAFLSKPFDIQDFESIIQALIPDSKK